MKTSENKAIQEVQLRQWYIQDSKAFALLSDTVDDSYDDHFVSRPCSDSEAMNWIMMMVDAEFEGRGIYRAIIADGNVVGLISVRIPNGNHGVDGELGFMIMPDACGKGIATRAVALMAEEVFKRKLIERLSSVVYEPNIASIRVLEKNGFVMEGRKANAVKNNGVVYDTLLYGLLRKNHTVF